MSGTDKKISIKAFLIAGFSILCVVLVIVYNLYLQAVKEKDRAFEALRSEYGEEVICLEKVISEYEYVGDVSVKTDFYTKNLKSKSAEFRDCIDIKITFIEKFGDISPKTQCEVMCNIDEKIKDMCQACYSDSGYYKFIEKNNINDGLKMIKYKGMNLSFWNEVDVEYYCKESKFYIGGKAEGGTFCISPIGQAQTPKNTRAYDYLYQNGKVTSFVNWRSKTITSSTAKDNSAGNKIYQKSSKSNSDSYNVHDYKSSQDFADDRYEEFYDYEDDFEDEDEAYDAAEDYWYDYY